MADVLVIGAGVGGLSAAIALAAGGHAVRVVEAAPHPGGKAGFVEVDGLRLDTGPSVLTLPGLVDAVFRSAGTRLADEVVLRRLDPGFRYRWPDGTVLDLHHAPEDSLASVHRALGSAAAADLREFLAYARRIWRAAAPHFVLGEAPSVGTILRRPHLLGRLPAIDPLRTMRQAIHQRVRSPHLRDVLARYATYNGSDPRSAPATLNCIAWVEIGLGGYGVRGGMYALVEALARVAVRSGARLHYASPVAALDLDGTAVRGVVLDDGTRLRADAVVVNADVAHLFERLLPPEAPDPGFSTPRAPSTSGWTGIARARRRTGRVARSPHTVLFSADPEAEVADLFDHDRPPEQPTVYLCAQEAAHGRVGWTAHEPVFVMANAPAEPPDGPRDPATWAALERRVIHRVREAGLLDPEDVLVWRRTPAGLASRFPGSRGSLYGAASNGRLAAFQRPPNRVAAMPGLYLASGSAHPGGGLPLCARSGLAAAAAVERDLGTPR